MKAPSKKIQHEARKLYDDFPSIPACWERSPEHKNYFIKYLGCCSLKEYHKHHHGCKQFDDFIARWSEEKHQRDFFTYYKVVGLSARDISYTHGIVTDKKKIRSLSRMSIRRKNREELNGRDIPNEYYSWPFSFSIPDLIHDSDERKDMIQSIEKCIRRRLMFRNGCIRACSRIIDTESHDIFLKILQIMRAQLIIDSNDINN